MAKRGRPIGSKTRPQFRDFITEDEVKNLVKVAKRQAETKPEILKFVLEQIFGKAPQPIGGDPDNPIIVKPIYGGISVKTLSENESERQDTETEEKN